jgi:hypothetical protein
MTLAHELGGTRDDVLVCGWGDEARPILGGNKSSDNHECEVLVGF